MVTMDMTVLGALFFRNLDHFAAFVAAAVRTSPVWELRFMAIRALGMTERAQMIVRPARRGPLLGVSAFRIRHVYSL
jgi:hypothetical protein